MRQYILELEEQILELKSKILDDEQFENLISYGSLTSENLDKFLLGDGDINYPINLRKDFPLNKPITTNALGVTLSNIFNDIKCIYYDYSKYYNQLNLLLNANININQKDEYGLTPIFYINGYKQLDTEYINNKFIKKW